MRFPPFVQSGAPRLGLVDGNAVIDLNAAMPHVPADLRQALKAGIDLDAAMGTLSNPIRAEG